MKNFERFTGLYPVQKTLRFELRPQPETKNFLKLSEDFIRAEYYPKLKKVLDDYYRYYIEQVLSKFDIGNEIDFVECYNAYNTAKTEKTQQAKKAYTKFTDNICKIVSKQLKDNCEDYQLDGEYKNLLKKGSKLYIHLDKRLSDGLISQEDYESAIKAIEVYNGYVTCLQGFQTNRKNIFEVTGATSIAFRVVENMERYFDNCNNYVRLISNHNELSQIFADVKDYFIPKDYSQFLSQTQIDRYNEIIGHSSDDVNEKGVNQKLNEYAQKNGLKRRDVPMMSILYKQILSDRQTFVIDNIKKDEDLFSLLADADVKLFETVNKLITIVSDSITENTYITRKSLTAISQDIYKEENAFSILNSAITYYCEVNKQKKEKYKTVISINDLQKAADCYSAESGIDKVNVIDYFKQFNSLDIVSASEKYAEIKDLKELSDDRQVPTSYQKAGKGYEQVQIIKNLFDAYIAVVRFYKPLYLVLSGKNIAPEDNDTIFYNQFVYEYEQLLSIFPLYNRVKKYITTVTKIDKTKIRTFLGSSNLLTGWDRNYKNNGCYIFYNKGQYYLVDVLDKKGIDFNKLETDDGKTWKVYYFLQKPDSKNFPRVFITAKTFEERANAYKGFEKVRNVYENKLYLTSATISKEEYKQNLITLIDYFKYALSVHESYNMIDFVFKDSAEYNNIQEFYDDAMKYGYKIEKVPANFEYLKQLEKENKVLVFNIYNKDFSTDKKSHGKDNLHTLYFKELFSDDNIRRINEGNPYIQLNGGAQIYTRPKSIERNITHVNNRPIENKNPLNDKPVSIFEYDLIKNRRFTEEKMFLHFPITLNSGTVDMRDKAFNESVNKYLYGNKDINIIGLDRGERHLLYYTVINQKGEILEQNSFNVLISEYTGGKKETNYHDLLDSKEKAMKEARQTWGKIEAIAPLKEGYLSIVVHKLAQLMMKHNAVLVLENLNKGMKNSRKKVEKQVYQKFEHAIIDKLNYLVFKDRLATENGGALNGYQLTNKLKKFDDIGKQNGFLFYIDPAYTSKICPKTGFVNLLKPEYLRVDKSKEYFSKFDFIRYNKDEGYFEFGIDYDKLGDINIARKKWTVCTYGDRYVYSSKRMSYEKLNVTEKLKSLFDRYSIDYNIGDIKDKIIAIEEKDFFVNLIYLFKATLQMRNTTGGELDENDYILSVVKDNNGKFFDSRNASEIEPKNADANGAYHIALKGLWVISHLSEDGKMTDCSREEWFAYRQ